MPAARFAARISPFRSLGATLAGLAMAGLAGVTVDSARAADRDLVIGRSSEAAGREIQALGPLARLLAEEARDLGIGGAAVVLLDDVALAEALRAGRVDLALEGPARAARLMGEGVARPLARAAIAGESECRGVVVAREGGSGDAQLTAVPDPDGLDGPLFDVGGMVGETVAAIERSPLDLLLAGEADRALLCESDLSGGAGAGLIVIQHGPPLPRALLMVRVGLDPALVERVLALVLRLPRDPAEAALLSRAHGITGFAPVTGADIALLHDEALPAAGASEP